MTITDWLLEILGLQRKVDEGKILYTNSSQRSWFRITSGDEVLEGTLLGNSLQITVKYKYESISTKLSAEHADRLIEWLLRNYPRKRPTITTGGSKNNVLKLTRKLPLPKPPTNPGGST